LYFGGDESKSVIFVSKEMDTKIQNKNTEINTNYYADLLSNLLIKFHNK
jgi:hypothetical protein